MITEYLVIEMGVGERIMRILREMEVGEEWPVPVHLHHVLQRPPRFTFNYHIYRTNLGF